MIRIEDPIIRRTLVKEIDAIAHMWADQADRSAAMGMREQAIAEAKCAKAVEQIARDIEEAT